MWSGNDRVRVRRTSYFQAASTCLALRPTSGAGGDNVAPHSAFFLDITPHHWERVAGLFCEEILPLRAGLNSTGRFVASQTRRFVAVQKTGRFVLEAISCACC